MKGLLLKDCLLLKNQTKLLAILVIFEVIFVLNGTDPMFIVSYCLFVCAMFAMSSVSYDDMNNGMEFLLTLPTSNKLYVFEKYCFVVLVSIISWGISNGIAMISVLNSKKAGFDSLEFMTETVAVFLICILLVSIMMPIRIKFGAEKERIVFMIFFGAMFLIGMLGKKSMEKLHIDLSWMQKIMEVNQSVLLSIGLMVTMIVLVISVIVTTKIVEKKEL